ncbi:hypothetical protein SLEP1_g6717 [Rubroshorea leprosula]|uniref:C3H1-type domain-containing protein n=1 Tax=Rubroshorea leprosula TaxID=152421 RepID=A0AAV5I5Y3_9ROSI|nr:hypothetical protein SLEP1_g6717 [Rubroshorea leprosula]
MSTICADQHKFFPSHLPNKKPFKEFLEIPPRKLLFSSSSGSFGFLHRHEPTIPYENNLHKFLPSNNGSDDEENGSDSDPYGTDHFRMYEFKVRRCTRSRSHDWTDCPFAHPGEKASRRDPRRFRYSSTVCSDFRRGGGCPRGDDCEFAHGVFECWLHPMRYRTEACKDGKNCKRKICFFAHSPRELRIPPEAPSPKYKNGASSCSSPLNKNHCCLFCQSVASSPTSTLLGLSHLSRSPPLSPPLSPVKQPSLSGHSPLSRYADRQRKFGSDMATVTYKDVLNELLASIEAMNFSEISSPVGNTTTKTTMNSNIPYLDVCFNGDDQQKFLQSPVPSPSNHPGDSFSARFAGDHAKLNYNGPDLGWVNELLM